MDTVHVSTRNYEFTFNIQPLAQPQGYFLEFQGGEGV